jgi:large subunit ribosomal protein L17e
MPKKYGFSTKGATGGVVKAQASQERVHFKPMFEVGRTIKGMAANEAVTYLEAVIAHKRAVPFRRYNEGVVHHAQGHEWGIPSARWPEKSCRVFLSLLKNALASAKDKQDIDQSKLYVTNVQCNRAQAFRYRRIHQAHGRVKCYTSPPTNVQIVLMQKTEAVPAA